MPVSVLNTHLRRSSELYVSSIQPRKTRKTGMLHVFWQWLTQSSESSQRLHARQSARPSNDQLWYKRGLRALAKRDYAKAIAYFNRVLIISSNQPEIWHSRGDALAALADYAGALISFDRALELQPDRYDTLAYRSSILMKMGRETEAIASLWF